METDFWDLPPVSDTVLSPNTTWTNEIALAWYSRQGWLCGCNYLPGTAINQLEMWQADTFDTTTINRELGWAKELGFNTMRVYLHHLLWTEDAAGFKNRLNTYLRIAAEHGLKTILVFFDDCWNDTARLGPQPAPKQGVHNSGWVQDPGTRLQKYPDTINTLKAYVQDVMGSFKQDERILMWDLYNEPGNNAQGTDGLPLVKKAFEWAREVNPTQPLTVGVWNHDAGYVEYNRFQLAHSDVITYHDYTGVDNHKQVIDSLKKYGRPLICTEYMARPSGSLFHLIMPLLKQEHIGAINWGLVSGKSNTIFAWKTPMPNVNEPALWFHDILRQDGTPFSMEEVAFIRSICIP